MQMADLPPLEVSDEAFYLDDNPTGGAWLSDGEMQVVADELKSDVVCPGHLGRRMLILWRVQASEAPSICAIQF